MGVIKDKFKEKADNLSAEVKDILKNHGDRIIGEVKLSQIYQGMRGITGLVTETSLLDSQDGIRFRGYSIPELREKLPKAEGGTEPLARRFILFNAGWRIAYRRRCSTHEQCMATQKPCSELCI